MKNMTKAEMIDFIETTGMIIDFDRNFLMRKLKKDIIRYYNMSIEYMNKKEQRG